MFNPFVEIIGPKGSRTSELIRTTLFEKYLIFTRIFFGSFADDGHFGVFDFPTLGLFWLIPYLTKLYAENLGSAISGVFRVGINSGASVDGIGGLIGMLLAPILAPIFLVLAFIAMAIISGVILTAKGIASAACAIALTPIIIPLHIMTWIIKQPHVKKIKNLLFRRKETNYLGQFLWGKLTSQHTQPIDTKIILENLNNFTSAKVVDVESRIENNEPHIALEASSGIQHSKDAYSYHFILTLSTIRDHPDAMKALMLLNVGKLLHLNNTFDYKKTDTNNKGYVLDWLSEKGVDIEIQTQKNQTPEEAVPLIPD